MQTKTIDGELFIVGGKTRSGKTAWTMRTAKSSPVVFAWDPQQQWCDLPRFQKIETYAELKQITLAGRRGRFAYCPSGDRAKEFNRFCLAAFLYAENFGPGGTFKPGPRLDIVVEELAGVTNPGKSTGHWFDLVTSSLKYGPRIFAISQRWQEADKTAFDNFSYIVLFRTSSRLSAEYFAKRTRIPFDAIEGLGDFEYLVYHVDGQMTRKRLPFKRQPAGEAPRETSLGTPGRQSDAPQV